MSDQLLKLKIWKNIFETIYFLEPGAFSTSSFVKITGPVTFLLYDLEC